MGLKCADKAHADESVFVFTNADFLVARLIFVILLNSVHCFEGITLVLITSYWSLVLLFTFHDIPISFTF